MSQIQSSVQSWPLHSLQVFGQAAGTKGKPGPKALKGGLKGKGRPSFLQGLPHMQDAIAGGASVPSGCLRISRSGHVVPLLPACCLPAACTLCADKHHQEVATMKTGGNAEGKSFLCSQHVSSTDSQGSGRQGRAPLQESANPAARTTLLLIRVL